ncbi:jg25758 [Pararge aegeria aegeria]|uniref:Jg25758 protein n=1 Tax=Pararge aegeria aegeria TaxID=348720 RepID=A0A8S4QSL6_9NEOP|nr:jg25758 [Pararge aegeria aegeria]
MKKASSANCDICGTMDDVQHVLVECSRYNLERLDEQPTTEGFRSVVEIFLRLRAEISRLLVSVKLELYECEASGDLIQRRLGGGRITDGA